MSPIFKRRLKQNAKPLLEPPVLVGGHFLCRREVHDETLA